MEGSAVEHGIERPFLGWVVGGAFYWGLRVAQPLTGYHPMELCRCLRLGGIRGPLSSFYPINVRKFLEPNKSAHPTAGSIQIRFRLPSRRGWPQRWAKKIMELSDAERKWLTERIRSIQDLEMLLVQAGGGWEIVEFRDIPMGWSTVIRDGTTQITLWSHRSEIEVEKILDGQWGPSQALNRGWDLKDSDFHIVSKVLENAQQEKAQQDAPSNGG